MLTSLAEREPGLVEIVLQLAAAGPLAQLAACARWLQELVLACAEKRVCRLISSCRHVSRWRRAVYGTSGDVLRELHHIECAAAYPSRVAGRYRLSAEVMLDVSPTGEFVNYSTGEHRESGALLPRGHDHRWRDYSA